jgi:pre-mRNA-splicing factor ATP-dependent RNA helicase DHX16
MLSLQGGSLFSVPKDRREQADAAHAALASPHGDHLTFLNIWQCWCRAGFTSQWCFDHYVQYRSMRRARDIRAQLAHLARRAGITVELRASSDADSIRKAFLSGFFFQIACQQRAGGEAYRTAKQSQSVFIHPSSTMHAQKPKWVVYNEIVLTSKEYMRNVTAIDPAWIAEIAPHYFVADPNSDDESTLAAALRKSLLS